MLDFGEFCYLDTPKTGSTFVADFLKRHCRLPVVREVKHLAVKIEPDTRGRKLFFSSIRHPYDTYVSLYAYGCDGRGNMVDRFRRGSYGDSVKFSGDQSDFMSWISIVTDPKFEQSYGRNYNLENAKNFGPLTNRFLKSNLPKGTKRAGWRTKEHLRKGYDRLGLPSIVLRNETLNDDLAVLIDQHLRPYLNNAEEALQELRNAERINASKTKKSFHLPWWWKWRIRRREWFLFEQFY